MGDFVHSLFQERWTVGWHNDGVPDGLSTVLRTARTRPVTTSRRGGMTSSKTRRTGSGLIHAARLPPRHQLPPGIVVERLPWLGTSWYERGPSYWARRAGGLILMLIAATVYITIIAAVIIAAGPPGSAGYLAVLIAEVVFSLGSASWIIGRTLRQAASEQPALPERGRIGARPGLFAYTGGGTASSVVLAISSLLTAGAVLAAVVIALAPLLPAEDLARRELAASLRQHPHARPGHGPTRYRRHPR
jgi:hypothetical protein